MLFLAFVVLIRICSLIDRFPSCAGRSGGRGALQANESPERPLGSVFRPPLRNLRSTHAAWPCALSTWCSAGPPKAPRTRAILSSLPPLPSISLPAVLSSSPLISQQRDATDRLSSRLKASNVDSTSHPKASCRLCENRCSDSPFFPFFASGLVPLSLVSFVRLPGARLVKFSI